MKKRKLLFTMLALGLGCFTGGSGAMAQSAGWDAVYAQTQTDTDDWTAITAGSTTGMTLGASGTTTYYYVKGSYNFGSATNYGVSGLKIQGTVYLYIPTGLTINCVGGHANGATGAGAGIELAAGTPTNTLYIIGSGTVTATGGNAADGSNGGSGTDADGDNGNSWTRTGTGGNGGNGGGGAGAGIGTRGGNGGNGGSGGRGYTYNDGAEDDSENGTDGSAGTAGGSAGAMGTLYVANDIALNTTGGSAATSGGTGGQRGKSFAYDGTSYNVTTGAGGGGGGGGFGGAASNIGTGGRGGGGGGGGCGGAQDWRSNSSGGVYCVYADGGKGGQNANGNYAGNGTDADTNGTAHANGWVYVANGSFNTTSDWNSASGDAKFGSPGSGGARGENDASAGTSNTGNLTYNITYIPVRTNINGKTGTTLNPLTVTYSPSSATDIVLPKNADGFQWVLSTYGKSCAPNGVGTSEFATATKEYYGGNLSETALRTIVLGHVYGDLVFQELPTRLNMKNSGSNEQELIEWSSVGYPITVRLEDRTIYRDNHWNTICLPFNMTKSQIASSPLRGATVYKLNTEVTGYYPSGNVNKVGYQVHDYGYPVLLFWFDNVDITASGTVLQAGKPYLVKWAEPTDATLDGNYKDNTNDGNSRHDLDFEGVTITETDGGSWVGAGTTDGNVTFKGTLSQSATLAAGDNTKLVLGVKDGKDKLYYPSKNMNVGACRGYFIIPAAAAAGAREMVMSFDEEGETTSISVPLNDHQQIITDDIFNLAGQRLSAPKKGVNIVNGKKVIIK